jgi:hypothetical protein
METLDGNIGWKYWIGLDAKILRPYKQYFQ